MRGMTPHEQNGDRAPTTAARTTVRPGLPEKARAIRRSAPARGRVRGDGHREDEEGRDPGQRRGDEAHALRKPGGVEHTESDEGEHEERNDPIRAPLRAARHGTGCPRHAGKWRYEAGRRCSSRPPVVLEFAKSEFGEARREVRGQSPGDAGTAHAAGGARRVGTRKGRHWNKGSVRHASRCVVLVRVRVRGRRLHVRAALLDQEVRSGADTGQVRPAPQRAAGSGLRDEADPAQAAEVVAQGRAGHTGRALGWRPR